MRQLFPFLLIVFCNTSFAQDKAIFIKDIDSLINQYLLDHDLPSAAVGVVHKDYVLYGKRVVRKRDQQTYVDNTLGSIYNIASVAKPFVATAIMLLVQEGKIDITLPVVNYLPNFNIDSHFKGDITVEQLLIHTSGLPNTSSPNDYDYIKVDTTNDALTNHIKSLSSIKIKFKPGKKYSYSNVGYEILGEIIAQVSGESFEEYINTHLFQPLEMENTSYILSEFSKSEIAQPHTGHPSKVTDRFPYNRAFSPSGNLFTSIEDMNKWMIFNLNSGQYGNFAPLSEEYFNMLTTPRVSTNKDDFIGLSWYVNDKIIFHDGLDLGFSSLMILFKKQKIGITVLINHQEGNCNELLNLIAKSIKY